ncbi:uncharacterized protein LOC131435793 isoform X2 [Malaya genurostris]|nr:uncharacterized protein LOC131435793 isoform X2 [Malaya genurostris]
MDLVNCLAYISDQFSTRTTAIDEDLERYRRLLKEKLDDAPKGARDGLTYAQDGVVYKDGYRVERFDEARLDQLNVKIRELERKSHEKDERLDQLNVQLQELERKSAEREIVIEEIRSRSLSRAISPDPTSSRGSTVLRDIPKILLDDEDSRASSKKFRPIYRDDELRRTIKKRSVSSNVSDDRSEELEALTRLEDDEATQMEDYEPLVYSRNDYQDPSSSKNKISPIQELCAMHENEYQQRKTESPSESVVVATGLDVEEDDRLEQLNQRLHSKSASPESTPEEASLTSSDDEHSQILSPSNVPNDHFEDLGALAQQEEVSVIHKNEEPRRMTESPSKSLTEPDSDDAEEKEIINWSNSRNTLPEIPNLTKELLLTTSESVPSNLSSRSGSPDPDHPALKRTRKKSDLTALLLEEERRTQAFREVIIQTEEYDSEASERSELQQSKSLTPSINNFLNNERASSAGQLQSPISDKSNSSTSEHESQQSSIASIPPSDSREPTISPVPIVSLGSAALNASSNADGSVEGVPARSDEDRSISSPAVPADRNVSKDESVSLASLDSSSGSLELHVDHTPVRPVLSPTEKQPSFKTTATDLGAGGADRKGSQSPSVAGGKPSPRRRFRTRKREARSVTPIEFNQTFMEQFSEQRISVSPTELEDYINSLDEIKIDPPKPVTPNYFLPSTPISSGIPSLLITDERGDDARFHDTLSKNAFYGERNASPIRILNHRVNYVEWIKKFPENMTSHLELEDYDSDDEEVENIINGSSLDSERNDRNRSDNIEIIEDRLKSTPEPSPVEELPIEQSKEDELSVDAAPISQHSDASLSSGSLPDVTSVDALVSPLPNSIPSPTTHFTPIHSPNLSLNASTPDSLSLSPRSLPKLIIPSHSPTPSPIPRGLTPDEMIYEIGHLDGLIFATKSPSPSPVPQTVLTPEELAYDIGNLGGLILGPPSRSASPRPASPSPTPGSSLSSPWTSLSYTGSGPDSTNSNANS